LITFQEYLREYQRVVEKGIRYVASHVDDCNDQFSLAVAALALAEGQGLPGHWLPDRADLQAQ